MVSNFVISRFWKLKGWVPQAFLIIGLVVCYIGITDYFQMDFHGLMLVVIALWAVTAAQKEIALINIGMYMKIYYTKEDVYV